MSSLRSYIELHAKQKDKLSVEVWKSFMRASLLWFKRGWHFMRSL